MKIGKCHICGEIAELTYEHVPPRAAFNSHKEFIYFGKDIIGSDNLPWDLSGKKGKQLQKGIGFQTLCGKCNNDTGGWYGKGFVDFTYKGYLGSYNKKVRSGEKIKISFPDIYPLRVLKQIIAMFFSINNDALSDVHPELRAIVLSKERKGIPREKFRIYLYLLRGSISRYAGLSVIGSIHTGETRILSELAAPPFGYVLEFNPKDAPIVEFCDITFLGNDFDFDQRTTLTLEIPTYESNTPFPGDYRGRVKVVEDYIRNKFLAKNSGKK